MKKSFKPIDLKNVETYSIKQRKSKVDVKDLGRPYEKGLSFKEFIETLPNILAARDIKEVADRIVEAYKGEKVVAVGMGAHVIKVGLGPVIIDLMEQGIITSVSMNGAGIIHDSELAMIGQTSEDVAAELKGGAFGMAEETGRILNEAVKDGVKNGYGIGRSVGERLLKEEFPYNGKSILAAGARLGIPVTVHVAVGTDIIHMSPHCSGAAVGEGSHTDFRLFSSVVSKLEGGVYLNIGSAVILPEVFLKALTLVRNLGHEVNNFTTVNMDFIQGYRPLTNVCKRPTMTGGRGYSLTGHHEIMVPLLAAMLKEQI
ncbi:MAG: hypothetical protein Q7T53_13065 [Deltaproteobacteria bacterium]|nr:hypothetical protein [Deltaproteobacteria bacterium]